MAKTNELNDLIGCAGSVSAAAKILRIRERTLHYWRGRGMPEYAQQHIALLLRSLRAGLVTVDGLLREADESAERRRAALSTQSIV